MRTAILILIFFFLFWFLIRTIIKRKQLLSSTELLILFGAKVLMSLLYGYVFLHAYGGDDTWDLNRIGMEEHLKLVSDPVGFFAELDPLAAIRRNPSIATGIYFQLLDYEWWLITKPLALFNFLSGGDYYVNAVFFSFISFWGHWWLFQLLVRKWPSKRRPFFLLIFLYPPILFWLSGIRADAMLFFFVSLCLFHFDRWITLHKKWSLLCFILAFIGIVICRPPFAALVVPGLLSWFIIEKWRIRPVSAFAGVFGICLLLFFATSLLPPVLNGPQVIANRQHVFLSLDGNTRFQLDTLQPAVASYIRVLPQAAVNTFVRPFPWEANGLLQVVTSLGVVFFWLMAAAAIFRHERAWKDNARSALWLLFLFCGVALYLLVGYTVPFPGAIVRYKCVPELWLLAGLVVLIDWKRTPLHTYYKKENV